MTIFFMFLIISLFNILGCAGLPNKCDIATFLGIAHRNNWGIARSYQWSNYGTLWRLFRKKLLRSLCSLRKKMLSRMQRRSHGYPQTWNHSYQFTGTYLFFKTTYKPKFEFSHSQCGNWGCSLPPTFSLYVNFPFNVKTIFK